MPLNKVVHELKGLGFDVTTNKLEYKLKEWNIRKNISKTTWSCIDHHINKRKREGKESEVVHCGKRVKRETVIKETNRHRDMTIFARLTASRQPTPPLPPDAEIVICTPPSLSMEFAPWPKTLPWLQFQTDTIRMIIANPVFGTENKRKFLSTTFGAIIPNLYGPGKDISYIGVSKLASMMGISMPESYPQEHIQRAYHLLKGPSADSMHECLALAIFNISNCMTNFDDVRTWDATIAILNCYGLMNIDMKKMRLKSITIDGFLNNLFSTMVQMLYFHERTNGNRAHRMLRWLLASGQDPNTLLTIWVEETLMITTALQVAVRLQILDFVEYLLGAGANVNLVPTKSNIRYVDSQSALELALDNNPSDAREQIIKLLLHHNASTNKIQALHLAVKYRHRNLVKELVERGADLCVAVPSQKAFLYEETALTIAARRGFAITEFVLNLIKLRYQFEPATNFVTADMLIAAAAKGDTDTFRLLWNYSDGTFTNCNGVTPLHAAARYGHFAMCQLLMPLYYRTRKSEIVSELTPLQLASYATRILAVRSFISAGEDVNEIAKYWHSITPKIARKFDIRFSVISKIQNLSPLNMALGNDAYSVSSMSCAAVLIKSGARLQGREVTLSVSHFHHELLAAALDAGADPNQRNGGLSALQHALDAPGSDTDSERRRDTVLLLLQRGAKLLGGELLSAAKRKMWDIVDILRMKGANFQDTDSHGTTVLEALILTEQTARAEWLLRTESCYDAGALCAAIQTRNHPLIQQLLLHRPTPPLPDELEVTALGLAAGLGEMDVLRRLLMNPPSAKLGLLPGCIEMGKYPSLDESYQGRKGCSIRGSPLSLAAGCITPREFQAILELRGHGFEVDKLTWVEIARKGNLALAQALLDNNRKDNIWNEAHSRYRLPNPLTIAMKHRNKELVVLFSAIGVSVNQSALPFELDRSPIQEAAEQGDMEIVEWLVDAGANIDAPPARRRGGTALQLAAAKGHIGLVKYLIDLGADVNASPAEYEGRTALEGAAEHGRLDTLSLLLSSGALITEASRRQYVRAVKLATSEGRHAAVRLLKEFGNWTAKDQQELDACIIGDGDDHDGYDDETGYTDELDDDSNVSDIDWISEAVSDDEMDE
ncbi:putative ankyrin repeat-containing domain protein [Rosellinia necatrix]|uniref:Putative ankyrin repeat-containing domain protein n=1 Tax=Rosellinia necatrix TaxID=77044 RepID=A0A1S7UIN2_ROSNE|nr:putative ankyrin repeat-containing domain protein [Rosellinia necatrix]